MYNDEIENAIVEFSEKYNVPQIKKDLIGVFDADDSVSLAYDAESESNKPMSRRVLPFSIFNSKADTEGDGEHWLLTLNLTRKKRDVFLFDSYGEQGFELFFFDDAVGNDLRESKLIRRFFFNRDQRKKVQDRDNSDSSGIRVKHRLFDVKKFKKLKRLLAKHLAKLSLGFFSNLEYYARELDVQHLNVYFVVNQLQPDLSKHCGAFVLYFLFNLYAPLKNFDVYFSDGIDVKYCKSILNSIFYRSSSAKGRLINQQIVSNFLLDERIKHSIPIISE